MKKLLLAMLMVSVLTGVSFAQLVTHDNQIWAGYEGREYAKTEKIKAELQTKAATEVAFQKVLEAHQSLIDGGLIQGQYFTEDHAIQQMFTRAIDLQEALATLRALDSKLAVICSSLVKHSYYVAPFKRAMTLKEINKEAQKRFPNLREEIYL